ncbi:hypothetical protein O9993_03480 [Vibrio lentus]|nr:hypothetical protein [Vibrio lentus]
MLPPNLVTHRMPSLVGSFPIAQIVAIVTIASRTHRTTCNRALAMEIQKRGGSQVVLVFIDKDDLDLAISRAIEYRLIIATS